MAYVGVEFSENDTVGLVHSSWLTPLKSEVFWPPYKTSCSFNKALTSAEEPDQSTWKLACIKRKFFECDDILKAQNKLKKCEVSSDIQSSDVENVKNKRKRFSTKRWSSSSSGDELQTNEKTKIRLPRPSSGLPEIRTVPTTSPGNSSAYLDTAQIGPAKIAEPQSTTNSHVNIGLEDIFREVRKLREELKEIRAILKTSRNLVAASLPNDLPVVLPLKDIESFQVLEQYLSNQEKLNDLASYLASLGGTGITGLVNRTLRTLLTNKLATGFNFSGQRSERSNKKAFSGTNLNLTTIRAVQVKLPAATQSEVENRIKIWLKHAKQRMQKMPDQPHN